MTRIRIGQVEKGEAQGQRGRGDGGEAAAHQPDPPLGLEALEQHDRHDQHEKQENGHGRGRGPVAVVEELEPERAPDHQRRRSRPDRSGITNSPTAGMKTRNEPAMMPGRASGTVIAPEGRGGRAAEIDRGLDQRAVMLLEVGVERQDHEGQVGVDDADMDGDLGIVDHERRLDDARATAGAALSSPSFLRMPIQA